MRRLLRISLAAGLITLASGAAATSPMPAEPELRELLRRAVTASESFADRFEAEVWLLDMSQRLARRIPDTRYRLELLQAVHREAARAKLLPELVLAVIEVESNFDQFAISVVGARGIMQVMPFWLKEIGRPGDNLFRLETNLRYGCTILKYYLDKEKGNLRAALSRYNGDRKGHVYAAKVDRAMKARWYRQ